VLLSFGLAWVHLLLLGGRGGHQVGFLERRQELAFPSPGRPRFTQKLLHGAVILGITFH